MIRKLYLIFLPFFFQLDPSKMDRIELAFRKFDLNHDGFLSRDEFDQVSLKIVINCNVL